VKEKEIVRARVTAVHDYGVEIEAEGRPGFIQPIEVSWEDRVRPADVAGTGDLVDVYVYAITVDRFYASIKMVHPELNPWADPRKYEVGSSHTGIVEEVSDWGAKVKLTIGAVGMILLGRFPGSYLRGQSLEVEIVDVDASSRKLELKPVVR
jgi:ribosomal protein S1